MNRDKALKSVYKVMQRIKNINGILATPMEDKEYVKVKYVWLFGSVLKGSQNPNDVDIFIEIAGAAEQNNLYYNENEKYIRKSRRKDIRPLANNSRLGLHGGFKVDKEFRKASGLCFRVESHNSLAKLLKKYMPHVSIHFVYDDLSFSKLDQKCLIYPRCDFDFEGAITEKFKKSLIVRKRIP